MMMSQNLSYFPWITISILHDFYKNKACGLEVVPDEETRTILQNCRLVFRKQSLTSWLLLKPQGENDDYRLELIFGEETKKLCFELKNQRPDFYYYSQQKAFPILGDGWFCSYLGRNGVFAQLKITVSKEMIIKKKRIKLDIDCKEKFWEIILIPRHTEKRNPIKLLETNRLLNFNLKGEVSLPGENQKAYRFVSEEKIKIKEQYPYQISLWEIRNKGERLLCNNLPYPQPHSYSIFSPRDTTTNYFYY